MMEFCNAVVQVIKTIMIYFIKISLNTNILIWEGDGYLQNNKKFERTADDIYLFLHDKSAKILYI